MKPEQQRIAIAEACGWTPLSSEEVRRRNAGQFYLQDGPWWRSEAERIVCTQKDLPDYCNDLNAMHEAEKKLCSTECAKYRDTLCSNPAVFDDSIGACIDWQIVHATARQRAEAFLRTINKWK
jgi:hypothetical protein